MSLLLVAGAGLILLEGPVAPSFLHHVALKPMDKQTPQAPADQHRAEIAKQEKAINFDSAGSTWAEKVDGAVPHQTPVLGEIPLSGKSAPTSPSE